jgi:hypothetical protein
LIEEIRSMAPALALILNPWGLGRGSGSQPSSMPPPAPKSMAVRADDIALRCLGQQLGAILEGRSAAQEVEALLMRVAVVEVHLVRRKPAAAIGARNLAELSQERRRHRLAPGDALDLALAIRGVVANVGRTLVSSRSHGPL